MDSPYGNFKIGSDKLFALLLLSFWYHKISQSKPNFRFVDEIPTLAKVQIP